MADNCPSLSHKFFSLSPPSSSDEEEVPLIQEPHCQPFDPFRSSLDSSSSLLQSDSYISTTDQPVQAASFGDFQNPEDHTNMSRSVSVPNKLQMRINTNEASAMQPETAPTRHNQSSVKHLTCFWWKEKGSCRFTDDECLYAHYDTGHHTEAPRQIIPGLPAVAGRTLERAVQNLEELTLRPRTAPGSEHGSRSGTPGPASATVTDRSFRMSSPFNVYHTQSEVNRVNSDNQFLKTLVTQNAQEKAILISHIEDLKAENNGMKAELEGLRTAQEQLLAEREGLHNRVQQLQAHNGALQGTFAYGRARMGSESRFLGGLLDD